MVSASASNEDDELQDVCSVPFLSGFTDDEFKIWCQSRKFLLSPPPSATNPNDAHVASLLDHTTTWVKPITGLVPLELDRLDEIRKTRPADPLGSVLDEYAESRVGRMKADLDFFVNRLTKTSYASNATLKRFGETCLALVTGVPLPLSEPVVMDKRIMYQELGTLRNKRVRYIKPVLPLARPVILDSTIPSEFNSWIGLALDQGDLTDDAKSRLLVLYLTHSIATERAINLPARRILSTGAGELKRIYTDLITSINVKDLDVEPFVGLEADLSAPTGSKLYIPRDPAYPDADFMVWDNCNYLLYVFQVTASPNHQGAHNNTWRPASDHFKAWRELLVPKEDREEEDFNDNSWQGKVMITTVTPENNTLLEGHSYLSLDDREVCRDLWNGPYPHLHKFVTRQ